jgi:hemolysin activation/secretion protein
LVANYSGFYRMPLSSTESFSDEAAQNANKFGYNEATRKFELPPATGATELNLYASRSTIDTGVELGVPKVLFSQPTETISQEVDHEDLTYNENLGFRLTKPLPDFFGIHHNFQIGLDYKGYREANFETNDFIRTEFLTNSSSQRITNGSVIYSPVPPTVETVQYLPISVHWEGTRDDPWGTTSLSLNYSPNLWFTGSRKSFDAISASSASTGFWHVISGDFSREQTLPDDWKMVVKLDGQWASEPLISNEQFGAGGFFGVRGYREGEIFGDDGWRVTTELKVPPYRVGYAGDGTSRPLIVRASFFMDYAGTYLIDPQGRPGATPLWGTGVAGAASLGTHFSGSLVFGVPLLSTPTTEACHPRINFVLTAEF